MKNLKLFIPIVLSVLVIACSNDDKTVAFELERDNVTLPAEGGAEKVKIQSPDAWVATTEAEWIMISPANGTGTTECRIIVDSTLINTFREATVRFTTASQDVKTISVKQSGFDKEIIASKTDISVEKYAAYGSRYFDVEITSNVDFSIKVPADAPWLTYSAPNLTLDRGSRPRTVKVRFQWDINTKPFERDAKITFAPKSEATLTRNDVLNVKQEAGDRIENNRQGDSMALLAIARNLNCWQSWESSEKLEDWNGVKVWESTDEGVTPERIGRVKSAAFALFSTKEGLPYEVQYLTYIDSLSFLGNANTHLISINIGEWITKLTNLKKLSVNGYGLTELPAEFAKLKQLERLDLGGNNFRKVPDVLTEENFPNLIDLRLNTNQRYAVFDLSNSIYDDIGMEGTLPRRLFEWENLEILSLGVNYFSGTIPDMLDYAVKYTEEDCTRDNLPRFLIGKPKVLPKMKELRLNLNRLVGKLPDWILYHPYLLEWSPDPLVFNQEGRDRAGKTAGFTNVPETYNYYYEIYPDKK